MLIGDWNFAYAGRHDPLATSGTHQQAAEVWKVGDVTFPVILETFYGEGEHLRAPRIRLVEGQGLGPDMRVDCCTQMRTSQPLGSYFELKVKLVPRQTGFALYAPRKAEFEVLSRAEVARRIARRGPIRL